MAVTTGKKTPKKPRDYDDIFISLENCILSSEKIDETPSMKDGIDRDTESELRVFGCELIQTSGILLKLPQVAMATGQVLLQRFYYSKSVVKHDVEVVAMAALFLAAKIEESPRRIRDVINVCHHIKQKMHQKPPSPMDYFSNTYFNLKNAVIKAERRILKELGFCVHVKHPHKIIITYLQILDSEKNTNLAKKAWNLMNDSLQTDVFVRFTPEKIACACIFLAARLIKVNLPVRPPWWQLFGAEVEEIEEISLSILKLYARPRRNISKLEATVGKAKKLLLEKKGKPPVTSESGSFTPAHVSSSVVNSTGSSSAPVRPSSKAGSPQEKSLSNGAVKYSAAMERDGIRSSEVSRSQNSSRPAKRSASQSPDRSLVAKRRSHSVSDYSSQSESESSSPERPSKKYAKQHADYEKRLPSKVVVQDRFVVAMDKDSVKENDLRSQRHGKGRSPVRLDRRVSPSLRKEKHRDKYADAKTSKLRRPQKVHR